MEEVEGRFLVLADVHANLEAFRAVLGHAGKPGVDYEHAVFLGDAVGYNASPNECIALLKELQRRVLEAGGFFAAVAGNHDDCLLASTEEGFRERLSWFNPVAAAAMVWTRSRVSQGNKEWLRSLLSEPSQAGGFKRFFATPSFYACHGGPGELYDAYAGLDYDPRAALEVVEQRVLFVGHTHELAVLPFGGKLFVNAPAVGQPRDGDARAGCLLFDSRALGALGELGERGEDPAKAVEVRRVDYEVEEAARKVIQAGLPKILAERLFAGE